MLPSQTVENYLKAIYQAQVALPDAKALVPMGHLSSTLGVVPGTATTMVKTLAESGLVRYEPYSGVRLTSAGEKLAARVLRRHRLLELFLVKVMGMSWAEVHDDAEQLEHAVSDRLIERIDEMLGHPSVDPHGDPIPGPEGTVARAEYDTLLSCPLEVPVIISRVLDQDPAFLRFVEESDLKPGQTIYIEERDGAADRVSVRVKNNRRLAIGTRAASKVLVQVAMVLLVVALGGRGASAQPAQAVPPPAPASSRPFEITDNSFLVEEAFNQEPNIFQNIFGLVRIGGEWEGIFTQEWPIGDETHQLSFSVPFLGGGGTSGLGDILVNYRFQALREGTGRPAFAPRASLILPTGDEDDGLGSGVVGFQVNLPFSKQVEDWYFHWNAGVTWLPGVKTAPSQSLGGASPVAADDIALTTPHAGASAIWRARPMIHLMLESLVEWEHVVSGPGATSRTTLFTISPGVRVGWNFGDRQLVLGLAMPATIGDDDTDAGVFTYASWELPFRR
jgi:DtxR family Mn-dependent transcriptional regulator